MSVHDRRAFLGKAAATAAALGADSWLARAARAQTTASSRARLIVDPARTIASLDRNLFGSFLEHLGRAVYGGVYEPGSKLADANGFRKDVLEEVRRLGVPVIRYPGGNFVSGYDWRDGVGPKSARPRVLDRAWNTAETNQFGTNEFVAWCRAAGAEPLFSTNFGTAGAEMSAALVEYCNTEKGTRWSELRRSHGIEKPHGVKYWCLGNEMDGPWQIGHMTASEYGMKAADAARQMRTVDPSLKLVACGSSAASMPTYLEWDRQTLEACYEWVDAISLHRYFGLGDPLVQDDPRYLGLNLEMERQIEEVAAVCDYVRGRKKSAKKLWLSFDEWNVWYRETNGDGKGQEAPRLLEDVYDLRDALLVGGAINSLLRHADRVRLACLAQLVNVIAPLTTNAEGVLRQSTYHPYAWSLAHARGQVLDLVVETEGYEVKGTGQVPYLDVAGTFDSQKGESCLLVLNRDLAKPRELELVWRETAPARLVKAEVLTGNDLRAVNTFAQPQRVSPRPLEVAKPAAKMVVELPPRSYSVIVFAAS